jgi:ADP-ribosyl-[dinitrogen reductase] hydrolase
MKNREPIRSILFGVCVGDSIGLPVQFKERYEVKKKPVTYLQGYGIFNLPPELASRGEI